MRTAACALAAGLVALAACAPAVPPAQPASLALDCARPFADLAGEIAALPGVKPATSPGEPYVFYNTAGGQVSYVVTTPAAPAHPAVLMQQVASQGGKRAMRTTGCAYGEHVAYDALLAYLQGLGAAKGGSGS